ncbi:MAG: TonB-dependent receptor [Colwellia sp.]|nr:TonB-dependent receptor [Colwellia sp.]MCW8863646.1 TonB-dependent receptor [Colwellia sp.]MCW9080386.1 TonB-dependent receptor [Colwellia sp.]
MVSVQEQSRNFKHSLLTTSILCGLALNSSLAMAEETAQENEARKIEVIEVTSQKRVENSQEVPIALSAFTTGDLRKIGAQTINDIGGATPGLDTNSRALTQPKIGIRGLTSTNSGIGGESNVVVYQDGVYAGRAGGAQINFNDIERIEVLKGPQGTLFGKNAAAGAIVMVSKKPHEDFEANYRLTLGNYNKRKLEGLINVPLTDNVYFRGSAVINQRDGYLDGFQYNDIYQNPDADPNSFTKTEFLNEDDMSARLSVLWEASSDTEVLFRAEYNEVDQDARPSYSVNRDVYRNEGTGDDPHGIYETDFNNVEGRELFTTSLEINSSLSWAEFTSITAYKTYDTFNYNEEDGSAHPKVYFNDLNDEEMDFYSQEFRFTGVTDNGLKWTVGASYSKEELEQTSSAQMSSNTIDAFAVNQALLAAGLPPTGIPGVVPGVIDTPAGLGIAGLLKQRVPGALQMLAQATGQTVNQVAMQIAQFNLDKPWTEYNDNTGDYTSYGLFADATYSITDDLSITAGIRWSKDEKDFTMLSYYQNTIDIPFPGVPSMPFGFRFQKQNFLTDENGQAILDDNGNYQAIQVSDSWSQVTPRFVVDYKLADNTMVYASYTEGYKAGGFNATNPSKSVDQEDVSNIEVGLKSTFLDDTVRFNATVYDYDYDNFQIRMLVDEGGVPQLSTINADVTGQGFEVETSWLATDNLMLSLNYSHVETEILSQVEQEGAPDIVGMELPNAPANKLFVSADYFVELDSGEINFHLNYTQFDERTFLDQTSVDKLPVDPNSIEGLTSDNNVDGYGLANLRITYEHVNDWQISLYANNLFDEEYLQQPVRGPGDQLGSPEIKGIGKPLMFGIEFSQTF